MLQRFCSRISHTVDLLKTRTRGKEPHALVGFIYRVPYWNNSLFWRVCALIVTTSVSCYLVFLFYGVPINDTKFLFCFSRTKDVNHLTNHLKNSHTFVATHKHQLNLTSNHTKRSILVYHQNRANGFPVEPTI